MSVSNTKNMMRMKKKNLKISIKIFALKKQIKYFLINKME